MGAILAPSVAARVWRILGWLAKLDGGRYGENATDCHRQCRRHGKPVPHPIAPEFEPVREDLAEEGEGAADRGQRGDDGLL